MSRIKKKADEHASSRRRTQINLIEFSFLDHKAELVGLLQAKSRQVGRSLVENEADFWKFVGKYEAMMRSTGQPVLPPRLAEAELSSMQPYHRSKHLALRLDADELLQEARDEMQSQFRHILLVYLDFRQTEKFQRIRKLRQTQRNLPIARFRKDLREALDTSRVVIVAGDTGCGKSTQVPQYLYDFGYRSIACTQPRRLACVSLCKRVAHELLDDYGSRVAFQIRFERSRTKLTNILFITEGLLLRQLAVAANLDQYDALILDEIHERNLFGDFLLGVTKCLLRARPQLKLILMSATINVELFHGYFGEEGARLVQVPGRLFPIKLRYLPPPALELKAGQATSKRSQRNRIDPAPFVQVLSLIDQQYPTSERGDVLIFVSGVNEIESVVEAVHEYATEQTHWLVLPLHSGQAIADQSKVFDYAPEGMRKCIVSTNIAETSLTVDGVRFVVDSGKVKEMNFDATCKGQRLKEFWVSKSSADQRKGRAGRTGPGVCFRLYTAEQYNAFEAYPTPEIYRVPLDTMLLQMVSMGLPDVRAFPFIEAPETERIEQTILALKQHCALSVEEKITPLGRSLANLPVELSIGKMLLMGSVFPEVEQLLTLAAMLSVQNPLTNRAHTDQRCVRERESLESDHGDLFTLVRLYNEWVQLKMRRDGTRQWCRRLGIEEQRFYEVTKLRQQFQRILESCGMVVASDSDSQLTSAERATRHGELRQLKAMKRRQRFEQPRQRKLLKQSAGRVAEDEEEQEEAQGDDMRDVDFRLRFDPRQLALLERSSRLDRHSVVVLLKLLLGSGFYPQLAISDEFNYCKGGGQQFFHTRLKPFVLQHPNSQFAKHFELLKLTESDLLPKPDFYTPKLPLSKRHQLLCYQSLLETAKPYLINCIRLPAAQTLLLFSFAIDTNAGITQIACDGWLGLDLPMPGSGMELLRRAIELRRRWNRLLYDKLDDLKSKQESPSHSSDDRSSALWQDLVDYMALDVAYAIRRLLPADIKRLYIHQAPSARLAELKENPFAVDFPMTPNEEKGGLNVSEHVVYSCLAEQQWTTAMDATLRAEPWQCTRCDFELEEFDVLEQLVHRSKCKRRKAQESRTAKTTSTESSTEVASSSSSHFSGGYYCNSCKRELRLTTIDILRHKKQCRNNK